jgi:signal transduction histidine kinase
MSVIENPVLVLAVLTGLVGLLLLILITAMVRMRSFTREARREAAGARTETTFMTSAMQEALSRLREQERALQARAEASERFSDEIVNGITSGVMLVDQGERLRIMNPAGRRLLGVSEAQVGLDVRAGLGGAPALVDLVRESLRARTPTARRLVTVTVEGRPAPLHLGVTVSPILDDAGAWQAVICLFTDLTAVMALEEQVKLQDSLARLGELAAGIAHEFRNGLATIHGYARMIDPARLDGPYADYIRGIRDETDALGRIVSTFLDFARPVQLAVAPVDLRALIERSVEELRDEAERLGGKVEIVGDWRLVSGDDAWLRQAFMNLVRNAIEASRAAARPPVVAIRGGADVTAGVQHIAIDDNGPGIPAEAAARLFQPFFTTKAQGTGLGLALVQKIIVMHKGRIGSANRPEGGARFVVSLPLA